MPEEQADAAEEHFLLKGSLAQASVTGNAAAKKQSLGKGRNMHLRGISYLRWLKRKIHRRLICRAVETS